MLHSLFRLKPIKAPRLAWLPLLFILLFTALAPAPAHATPTGPSDGMFDCLGDLDWGCKIIGFLFDDQNNTVTYMKDDKPVEDTPGAVQGALRKMMRFFSEAMLIIASIKLLYELIQMTAESAHTGKPGGEANKLWAPIRLVIAIGLLVPLASGMNSGQYIVMTIAKLGSGLASQTWKVFAEKFSEGQKLANPKSAHFNARNLVASTLHIYVCKEIVNYYSQGSSSWFGLVTTPPDLVAEQIQSSGIVTKKVFGNNIDNAICGTIIYNAPQQATGSSPDDADYVNLATANQNLFQNVTEPQIATKAKQIAQLFLTDTSVTLSSTQTTDDLANTFITTMDNSFASSSTGANAFKAITKKIIDASDQQGWTSAGVWFLAITRAQGDIINGGYSMPSAQAPNVSKIAKTGNDVIVKKYVAFEDWFNNSTRPQDNTGAAVGAPQAEASSYSLLHAISTGEFGISFILQILDNMAVMGHLWDSDPMKAFGDLGSSANPFGEIAEFGYKKIHLALDYVGLIFEVGVAALGVNLAAGFAISVPILGGMLSGLASGLGYILPTFFSLCTFAAFILLLGGVLLAFVVPMLAFIHFFFAILTWLGSLVEAMIAAPFFALAHLTPKGEGFAGPHTRNAYLLLFQVLVRPVLYIFGLIGSFLMFYVGAKFLNAMFYEAAKSVHVFDGSTAFVAKLVFSVMYAMLLYGIANTSFKMIDHIPNHALKWMGGSAHAEDYSHKESIGAVGTYFAATQLKGYVDKVGALGGTLAGLGKPPPKKPKPSGTDNGSGNGGGGGGSFPRGPVPPGWGGDRLDKSDWAKMRKEAETVEPVDPGDRKSGPDGGFNSSESGPAGLGKSRSDSSEERLGGDSYAATLPKTPGGYDYPGMAGASLASYGGAASVGGIPTSPLASTLIGSMSGSAVLTSGGTKPPIDNEGRTAAQMANDAATRAREQAEVAGRGAALSTNAATLAINASFGGKKLSSSNPTKKDDA